MSDIFGIAIVAAIAATLYEIRYAIIAALLVLALFKAGQYLVEWWKESGRKHQAEQSAILERADRQHRAVLAGDDYGVYGNSDTRLIFRDVAKRISVETEGFTRPITTETVRMPFRPSGSPVGKGTSRSGVITLPTTENPRTELPLSQQGYPIYPRPNWGEIIDLDRTDRPTL